MFLNEREKNITARSNKLPCVPSIGYLLFEQNIRYKNVYINLTLKAVQ